MSKTMTRQVVNPVLWAAFQGGTPLTALQVTELQQVIDHAFRAGQERMRDESAGLALVPLMNAATTYDPAKGERPICYDCTRGVAKALELYRAAIRALPLEEAG